MNLEQVKEELEESGYTAHVTDLLLLVSLGKDQKDRDQILEISTDDDGVMRFFTVLPFEVKEEVFDDMARLVLMINKVALLPCFGMSETDKCVTFHTVHFDVTPDRLLFIISSIIYLFEIFSQKCEEIANGSINLAKMLELVSKEYR